MADGSPRRAAIIRSNSRQYNPAFSEENHYGYIPPMLDSLKSTPMPVAPLPSMVVPHVDSPLPGSMPATSSRSGSIVNNQTPGHGEVMGGIDPRMTITILQAEVSRLKEENQRVTGAYQDALLSVSSVKLTDHKREEDQLNRVKELHQRDIHEKLQENQLLQAENERLLSELAAAEKRAQQFQDRATLAERLLKEEMEESLQELKKRNNECNELQTRVSQLQQECAIANEQAAKANRFAVENAKEAALAKEKYRQLQAQMQSSSSRSSSSASGITQNRSGSLDASSPQSSPFSTLRTHTQSPLSIASNSPVSAHSPDDMRISGMIASASTATLAALANHPTASSHSTSANSSLNSSTSSCSSREDLRPLEASPSKGSSSAASAPLSQVNSRRTDMDSRTRKGSNSIHPLPGKQYEEEAEEARSKKIKKRSKKKKKKEEADLPLLRRSNFTSDP